MNTFSLLIYSDRFTRKDVASYLFNDVSTLMHICTFLGPFIYSVTSDIEIG